MGPDNERATESYTDQLMILLCGATGLLGSRIAARLAQRSLPFRALVRPGSDATALERLGVGIFRGDLRDIATLRPAVAGVQTVISTANALARILSGDKKLTLRDVDKRGNANLVRAAEEAGVQRFLFLSFPAAILATSTPFADAKVATERRLRDSSMHEVIIRPDAYQEVWLSPAVQFDWPNRSVTIFGKGNAPAAYIAVGDVAEAVVRLAVAEDPPRLLEFGGPQAMTRNEAADAFEQALGEPIQRRHVPRLTLRLGAIALRPFKPALASVMGQALRADLVKAAPSDAPLRDLGIDPRPVSAYISEVTAGATRGS
jgi:NADH dehydrogenase